MKSWFRIQAASAENPTVAEIHIIDFIGSWDDDWIARNFGYDMGVTARSFIEELAKLPEAVNTIHLHINSPGGDVQAGVNIANALREQQASKGRTVETFIDGIAASIASVIAMAGSKVHIGDNALVMIHNPWSIAIGEAKDMRKTADVLDTMRGQIINTYRWHSELEPEAIAALMDAETWMDADQAIAQGFATDKREGLKAAASIDPKAVAKLKVPEQFKARVDAMVVKPAPAPAPPVAASAADVLRVCREGDCLALAEELIAAGATVDQVTARVTTEKQTRAAAAARSAEITALCGTAKLPELAAGYIKGAMAVDDIRAHLTTLTARLDAIEIDGGIDPQQGARAKARLDPNAIYAERNRASAPTKH